MAANQTSTMHAPLTRLAHALVQKYLLIMITGGVIAFTAFVLLRQFGLAEELRAGIAIAGALLLQIVVAFLLQKNAISKQLAPIDHAIESIAQLDAANTNESTGLQQRILNSHDTLQAMQAASAKALLDAKLVNVRLNHLDNVLNTLPFGLIVFDGDAKIAFANRALSPMLGQQSNQLPGKQLDDWCDMPDLQEYLSQRLVKKQHTANSITVSHPQRPNRWIQVTIRDLIESKSDACVATFYDSTDAVQAQKARGEFVTSLSHELKTPLHTMNLFAETLRGPDGDDSEIRLDAANVIGDEIERIDSLIRNLLDATRIETGTLNLERSRVRMPELLSDCLERIHANLQERQITLVSNIPKAMQAVYLDKTMFSVALNNLLSNAVKYNRDQGTLTVDMKETDDAVTITIADTGVGIPEKDLPFVFDKFYRASNVGKDGHGVGLSLAREIVQKHQGRLTVTSDEGQGTTFTLTLIKSAALTREAA